MTGKDLLSTPKLPSGRELEKSGQGGGCWVTVHRFSMEAGLATCWGGNDIYEPTPSSRSTSIVARADVSRLEAQDAEDGEPKGSRTLNKRQRAAARKAVALEYARSVGLTVELAPNRRVALKIPDLRRRS